MKMPAWILVTIFLMLTGCAGLGQSNLSAEQLKYLAADKSIGVMTTEIAGIWGTLKNRVVTVDKGTLVDGAINILPDGTMTITNRAASRPAGGAALVSVPVLVQGVPQIQ